MSILDRIFINKQTQNITLKENDLHLYGLVAIMLSSKLNDVKVITLKELYEKAAFRKISI